MTCFAVWRLAELLRASALSRITSPRTAPSLRVCVCDGNIFLASNRSSALYPSPSDPEMAARVWEYPPHEPQPLQSSLQLYHLRIIPSSTRRSPPLHINNLLVVSGSTSLEFLLFVSKPPCDTQPQALHHARHDRFWGNSFSSRDLLNRFCNLG